MRPLFVLLFISVFIIDGCNAIYIPATPSTPVFAKGNSIKLNSTFGASGFNASLDYSPINHYYIGGEWHGMKLMSLDSNRQMNAGGHIGYYFSPGDEDSHLNFQVGYNFGNSHYADVFDDLQSHLHSTSCVYETYHAQAYYVQDFRQEKFFGVGLRFDYFKGSYTDINSIIFTKSLPAKTVLPMAFAFFEYPFGRNSPWNLNAMAAMQISTAQLQDKNASQDVPGFYTHFIFRVGIAYQLHFGK